MQMGMLLLSALLAGQVNITPDLMRFRSDLARMAKDIRPEIEQIHRHLLENLDDGKKHLLQNVRFDVVAEDKYLCLDAFNAYTDGHRIVIGMGLWRRLSLLAFCHASLLQDHTNFIEEFLTDVINNEHPEGSEYWTAYGQTFGESGSSTLADRSLALLEAYLMGVIAHEQAHIYLGHDSPAPSLEKNRKREIEADKAALEQLTKMDPTGDLAAVTAIPHFYMLVGLLGIGDKDKVSEFISKSTHPHPLTRLRVFCQFIRRNQSGSDKETIMRVKEGLNGLEEAIRRYEQSDFPQP